MSEQWYYARNNQKHGPYSATQLKQLATSGQLQPSDMVKKDGMTKWMPAAQVKGLFAAPAQMGSDPTPSTKVNPAPVANLAETNSAEKSRHNEAKPGRGKLIPWAVVGGVSLMGVVLVVAGLTFFLKGKKQGDQARSEKTDNPSDSSRASWDSHSVIKCDLKYPNAEMCVVFSPDGKTVAFNGAEVPLQLYDVPTSSHLSTVDTEGGRSWTIAFSPDGKNIAYPVGRKDRKYVIKQVAGDVVTMLDYHRFSRSPNSPPYSANSYIAFSPNGKIVATASQDAGTAQRPHEKQVKLWDAATWQLQSELRGCYPIAFSPDGNMIAMRNGKTYGSPKGHEEDSIVLWDIAAGKEKSILQPEKKEIAISALAFSPDGSLLAALHGQELLNIWNVKSGAVSKQIKPSFGVVTIAFSPDGKHLVGVGGILRNEKVGFITIWDLDHDTEARLEGHTGWVQSAAFSKNGEMLATIGCDKTVRLWKRRSDEKGPFVFRSKDVGTVKSTSKR